ETATEPGHELRFVGFKVSEQLACSNANDFRGSSFIQRREQWFDARLELGESSEYAIVLSDTELRRLRSWFGPGRITSRARNPSQDVKQFHRFLFHLLLLPFLLFLLCLFVAQFFALTVSSRDESSTSRSTVA